MIDPDRALDYLDFVAARHSVWCLRQAGHPGPWTTDPIVAARKFTNVFRILDPGTQYVLSTLALPDDDPLDVFTRLFLYRHTGQVDAWEWVRGEVGRPALGNLDDVLAAWQEYRRLGGTIFTSAYLVYPQSSTKGTDKIEAIVRLTERVVAEVGRAFPRTTMRQQFDLLRMNKGVGDFMSMQILTDWGYTLQCGSDHENDFVVCGPGARKGALALDPHSKPEETLEWAYGVLNQSNRIRAGEAVSRPAVLPVPGGADRLPSRMDVQNTLCEFSKYVRYQSRPSATKPYVPAHPGPQPAPLLPRHWQRF